MGLVDREGRAGGSRLGGEVGSTAGAALFSFGPSRCDPALSPGCGMHLLQWEQDDLWGPFQPRPLWDSGILWCSHPQTSSCLPDLGFSSLPFVPERSGRIIPLE